MGGKKLRGKAAAAAKKDRPPPLPHWFLYIAYTMSTLWMLVCGYFVVIYGLLFEANSCTFKKCDSSPALQACDIMTLV